MKPKPIKEELKKKATALKLKLKRAAAALEQHRLESEAAAQEAADLLDRWTCHQSLWQRFCTIFK